jgi:hypothetical protein
MALFDASLHVRQVKPREGTPPLCTRHSIKGAARLGGGGALAQPLQRGRKSGQSFELVVADEPAANQRLPSVAASINHTSRAQQSGRTRKAASPCRPFGSF